MRGIDDLTCTILSSRRLSRVAKCRFAEKRAELNLAELTRQLIALGYGKCREEERPSRVAFPSSDTVFALAKQPRCRIVRYYYTHAGMKEGEHRDTERTTRENNSELVFACFAGFNRRRLPVQEPLCLVCLPPACQSFMRVVLCLPSFLLFFPFP